MTFERGSSLRAKIICLILLLPAGYLWDSKRAEARPSGAARVKAQVTGAAVESRRLRILAIRLRPGQDLRQAIEELVKAQHIRAGFILTTVGSLRKAIIRLADQKEPTTFAGKFEIVSLVGTMGQDGVHLHLSFADSDGKTIGGHLVDGCLIYTTAEILIGEAQGLTFSRDQDAETGFKELKIRRNRR